MRSWRWASPRGRWSSTRPTMPLGSAAVVAAADPRVEQVLILTPDKDLGQCVRGERVVQFDRRNRVPSTRRRIIAKFGVPPAAIADWLALVGDSADGFPGIAGFGREERDRGPRPLRFDGRTSRRRAGMCRGCAAPTSSRRASPASATWRCCFAARDDRRRLRGRQRRFLALERSHGALQVGCSGPRRAEPGGAG